MSKFISLTGLSEFLTKCRALFYTKPDSGIPASDLAEGVIPETIESAEVSVDANTGTPSASASVSGGVLSLEFHNLKGETGPQGNTGSSVDYPYELVNNLTTDNATKGLSAAQGKVLQDEVSQLGQEADAIIATTETPTVNLFDKTAALQGKYINKKDGNVGSNAPNTATDFIPIDSRGLYFTAGYAGGAAIGCAVYDTNKQYLRAGGPQAVTYQEGDAFVRFSLLTANIDTAMCVAGTVADVPSEYVPYGTIRSYSVKDDVIGTNNIVDKSVTEDKIADGILMGNEVVKKTETISPNIFNKETASDNYAIVKTTGQITGLSDYSCSAYIEVPDGASSLYCNKSASIGVCGYAFYDASKNYTHGGGDNTMIVQSGDKYVRLTIKTEDKDVCMVVVGTSEDLPSEYMPYGIITKYSLKDDVVPFDALAFKSLQTGKNKLNKAEISDGQYIDRNTGAVANWSANAATPFIPVSKKGLFFNKYFYGGAVIGAAVYDERKQYLREATNPYIYQEGDGFVRYSMLIENKDAAQVEEGSVETEYEEYTEREVIDPTYLPDSTSDCTDTEKAVNVVLPSRLYAVVGDTLQVFFKQCVQAVAPLNYNILVACAKGRQYHRYFEYTPTAGDVGETTFKIYVKNDSGEIVGNGSCTLVTVAVPSSPATTKRILCVGDSLTANGKWPAEAYRRLSGSGGTPSGDGLTNISFVGSMTKDGAGYLGNSGWTWRDFCTQGRPAFRFTVGTGISVNIGAVYSNNSHNYTVIELSDNGTILCSAASSSDTPQASGILTKVSGGGDATIAYSAVTSDSQNPFWDGTKLTFVPYVNNYCGGSVDEVFVLLGGNGLVNWKYDFSEYVRYMEDFADTLHAEYPSAKLVLMGMQFPSMELMMPGYGASGSLYADTYGILVSIARLRELYKEFAERDEYRDFVSAIDIGCQFDGDYNYSITEKAVNTRMSSKTEPYDNNALHPGDAGYMQYADAVYRAICAELS